MSTDERAAVGCPFWVQALLDLSGEPAVYLRGDGAVEAANVAALQLLEADDLPRFRTAWPTLDAARESGGTQSLRAEVKVAGQLRRLQLEMLPVQDEQRALGHVVALRDEEHLGRHLLHSGRTTLTSRLLRSLCHDLRTPLHSMVLQLDLLREELGTGHEQTREQLDALARQIDALTDRIDMLHALSSVGPSDPDARFDLRHLARDARDFARMLGSDGDLDVTVRLPEREVPFVGRRLQLLQIVMQLVAAAIDATRGEGRLAIALAVERQMARLDVVASGPNVRSEATRAALAASLDGSHASRAPQDAARSALQALHLAVAMHAGTLSLEGHSGEARTTLRLPLVRGRG